MALGGRKGQRRVLEKFRKQNQQDLLTGYMCGVREGKEGLESRTTNFGSKQQLQ